MVNLAFPILFLLMAHQLKNLALHVKDILVCYRFYFEVLDTVLMGIEFYSKCFCILDISVNPNVIHKMKFHLRQ